LRVGDIDVEAGPILVANAPILQRQFPRLIKSDQIRPAQSKVCLKRGAFDVLLTFKNHSDKPARRSRWINDQLQPAAAAMPPSAQVIHQLLGQLSGERHLLWQTSND
jgi:hypothetical protein